MRFGLKILGVAFALGGVFFLSIFPFPLGNAIRTSDNGAIIASCILAVIGFGFIFVGRYSFRLDPETGDTPRPTSKLGHYLAAHRQSLRALAQTGFVLALIRLIAACFGSDWPARWTTWFLLMGAFALNYCGKKAANPAVMDNRDWMRVPTWMRHVLAGAQNAMNVLVLGMALLFLYAQRSHSTSEASHFVARVAANALAAFVYALTALFFAYGELHPRNNKTQSLN